MKAPGPTLNRWQLAGLMLVLVLVPFAFVVGMAVFLKAQPEPKLDARIELKIDAWSPPGDTSQSKARLIELMVVQNPTQDEWRNVAVAINEQFYFYHPDPLPAGQSITIPLATFITKSGSVAFRPATQTIKLVTVFAQIPNGERAVCEREVKREEFDKAYRKE
jgi:hypothetical protein